MKDSGKDEVRNKAMIINASKVNIFSDKANGLKDENKDFKGQKGSFGWEIDDHIEMIHLVNDHKEKVIEDNHATGYWTSCENINKRVNTIRKNSLNQLPIRQIIANKLERVNKVGNEQEDFCIQEREVNFIDFV